MSRRPSRSARRPALPLGLWLRLGGFTLGGAVLAYAALRSLKLYKRPQRGTFHAHVPRLVRGALAVTVGLLVGIDITAEIVV